MVSSILWHDLTLPPINLYSVPRGSMAAMNDVTGDTLSSKPLSLEGEKNFEAIFGKRDWRNRPIQTDRRDSDGAESRIISRHSDSKAT